MAEAAGWARFLGHEESKQTYGKKDALKALGLTKLATTKNSMKMHFSNKAGVKDGYTNMMHSYNLIDDHCPLLMLGKIAFIEAKKKKWSHQCNGLPVD